MLLHSAVRISCGGSIAHVVAHVSSAEDSIAWNHVVCLAWLVVVFVSEARGVSHSHHEWHVGVTIVDCVAFLAVEELEQVVLDDWVLVLSADIGSGGVSSDSVTEGKDVLVLLVLKGVFVDPDFTLMLSKICILVV